MQSGSKLPIVPLVEPVTKKNPLLNHAWPPTWFPQSAIVGVVVRTMIGMVTSGVGHEKTGCTPPMA